MAKSKYDTVPHRHYSSVSKSTRNGMSWGPVIKGLKLELKVLEELLFLETCPE